MLTKSFVEFSLTYLLISSSCSYYCGIIVFLYIFSSNCCPFLSLKICFSDQWPKWPMADQFRSHLDSEILFNAFMQWSFNYYYHYYYYDYSIELNRRNEMNGGYDIEFVHKANIFQILSKNDAHMCNVYHTNNNDCALGTITSYNLCYFRWYFFWSAFYLVEMIFAVAFSVNAIWWEGV